MKNLKLVLAATCFVLGSTVLAAEVGHLQTGELGKDWCKAGLKGWSYDGKNGDPFGAGKFMCALAKCVPKDQVVLFAGRIYNFKGATPDYLFSTPRCCNLPTPARCTGVVKDGNRECQESAVCPR